MAFQQNGVIQRAAEKGFSCGADTGLSLLLAETLFWFHVCSTLDGSTSPVASNHSLWQKFQCFMNSCHEILKTYCFLL